MKKQIKRFQRGVSPIIAEILLIGLVMLAGTITFGTVLLVMNTKEPIVVSITDVSDFKLENSTPSTKYNSFSFVLNNEGKRAIGTKGSNFSLYNGTTGLPLSNWIMSRDYELASLQSISVTISSNSILEVDWLTFNSSIKIELLIFGLDEEYSTAQKVATSTTVNINSNMVAKGPIRIIHNQTTTNNFNYASLEPANPNNNSIEIVAQNFGNTNVSYSLEFIVSNNSIGITNKYINTLTNLSSVIYGSLEAANGNLPSSSAEKTTNETIVLTVFLVPPAISNEYYVIIWLKLDSTIQDTLIIVCK